MTKNDTVNTSLLTIGTIFVSLIPASFQTNFWYGIVATIVGVGVFTVYELLP